MNHIFPVVGATAFLDQAQSTFFSRLKSGIPRSVFESEQMATRLSIAAVFKLPFMCLVFNS